MVTWQVKSIQKKAQIVRRGSEIYLPETSLEGDSRWNFVEENRAGGCLHLEGNRPLTPSHMPFDIRRFPGMSQKRGTDVVVFKYSFLDRHSESTLDTAAQRCFQHNGSRNDSVQECLMACMI